jgi:predicted RNA-binding Zn-ribbon protein involved in translation (DUF1610 family)
MTERTFEVRQIGVEYLCDKCGGFMRQTGIMLPVDPPKYRHKCDCCGETADLSGAYPAVRWKRVATDHSKGQE